MHYDDVFAIGDVTTVKLPKAGVFAHFEAEVVAKQIAAALRGKDSDAEFDGRGSPGGVSTWSPSRGSS